MRLLRRNYGTMCRICLIDSVLLQSIYRVDDFFGGNAKIFEVITTCASIQIEENDGLPNHICFLCMRELQRLVVFRKLCERSDIQLRSGFREVQRTSVIQQQIGYGQQGRHNNDVVSIDLISDNEEEDEVTIVSVHGPGDFNYQEATKQRVDDAVDDDYDESNISDESMDDIKMEVVEQVEQLPQVENPRTEVQATVAQNPSNEFLGSLRESGGENLVQQSSSLMKNNVRNNEIFKSSGTALLRNLLGNSAPTNVQPAVNLPPVVQTDSPAFKCPTCAKKYSGHRPFLKHVSTCREKIEKPFSCTLCAERFRFDFELSTHMKAHSGEITYTCRTCMKEFPSAQDLKVHLGQHGANILFECEYCKYTTRSELEASEHMGTHTKVNWKTCSLCGLSLPSVAAFDAHRILCKEKLVKCDLCERILPETQLESHKELCKLQPRECSLCKQQFPNMDAFIEHLRACILKAVTCTTCNIQFPNVKAIFEHRKVCALKKCTVCGRDFENEREFSDHLPGCNWLPVICNVCNTQFQNVNLLRDHETVCCTPKECTVCSGQLPNAVAFKEHVQNCRVDSITCEMCVVNFSNSEEFQAHLNVCQNRPKECLLCEAQFTNGLDFKDHVKKCRANPVICENCKLQFPNVRALQKHRDASEEKTIPCTVCSKQFCTRTSFTDHLKACLVATQVCKVCSQSFLSLPELESHEEICRQKKVCELCKERFPSDMMLRVHREFCKEGQRECSYCNLQLPDYAKWQDHEKFCKDTPRKCDFCNKMIPNPILLRLHKDMCKETAKGCPFCLKDLPNQLLLVSHLKFCKQRKETCKDCKKVYYPLQKKHVCRLWVKRFECRICHKTFSSKQWLTTHEHRHTTKAHCKTCSRTFTNQKRLEQHLKFDACHTKTKLPQQPPVVNNVECSAPNVNVTQSFQINQMQPSSVDQSYSFQPMEAETSSGTKNRPRINILQVVNIE